MMMGFFDDFVVDAATAATENEPRAAAAAVRATAGATTPAELREAADACRRLARAGGGPLLYLDASRLEGRAGQALSVPGGDEAFAAALAPLVPKR